MELWIKKREGVLSNQDQNTFYSIICDIFLIPMAHGLIVSHPNNAWMSYWIPADLDTLSCLGHNSTVNYHPSTMSLEPERDTLCVILLMDFSKDNDLWSLIVLKYCLWMCYKGKGCIPCQLVALFETLHLHNNNWFITKP